MNTILQMSSDLRKLLTEDADVLAKQTGFIQRQRKFSGSTFALSILFGWLGNPQSSVHQLVARALNFKVNISDQGLDQRFSKESADFMRKLFERAVQMITFTGEPRVQPLLERFKGVYLYDSSIITLPNSFRSLWQGCGNQHGGGKAAIKIQVRLNLSNGEIYFGPMSNGCTNDKKLQMFNEPLPQGSLSIADKGFFDLAAFEALTARGNYWLSRLHAAIRVYDEEGAPYDLVKWLKKHHNGVDCGVLLGREAQMPARLIAVPVSNEVANKRRAAIRQAAHKHGRTPRKQTLALAQWSLYVTNVPLQMLSVGEVEILVRTRWQIELLFKRWKSLGEIDASRSGNDYRILTEVYSKLLAMVLASRMTAVLGWADPQGSQWKQLEVIRDYALVLARAFVLDVKAFAAQLGDLIPHMAKCQLNKRKKSPSCAQLIGGAAQ